ncbi:MAG: rod shape-determining protein RodA [Candidatus Rokubacteria bacterium]|nr:rod shape-determining protein RodA [Candidatus Rokubacteria bacterium]
MFRIDRRLLLHFDWLLVGLAALLVGAGLLTLGSLVPRLLMRQLAWLGIGAVVVLVLISIDYRVLARWAYLGYIAGLMVLAAVLVLGRTAQGARRWLAVGPLTVQPSELFKLVLILTVAAYLASREDHRPGWDRVALPLLLVAPAFALIVKQPDLGTALVLIPVVMALLFVGGARWRDLALLMGGGLAAAPVFWFFLRDYQRERLLVYLDPFRDPLGSAWNVIQAKITIGSGQLVGKGLFGGTQSRLAFLPERHTDFIFAAFAESWGFLGAIGLLAAYGLLALRGLEVAATARDSLGSLLATGATVLLASQALVNLGMVTGLLPIVGIPLPMVSYGGSALLTALGAVALIENVRMRRFA